MKNQSFPITILLFLASALAVTANAKEAKIKYSKYVEYKGETINKTPNGKGVIKIYSHTDKKSPIITIAGIFSKAVENAGEIDATDAEVNVSDGISISSPKTAVRIDTREEHDNITIDILDAVIKDKNYKIKTEGLSTLCAILRKQGYKECSISFSSPEIGNIVSSHQPIPDITNRLSDINEILTQESFKYSIEDDIYSMRNESETIIQPVAISLNDLVEATFQSGLKVKKDGDRIQYLYPNGNYVKYQGDKCTEAKLILKDGKISFSGNDIEIVYNDGSRFITSDLNGIGLKDDMIPKIQTINDISFINGTYYPVDNNFTKYANGAITAKRVKGGTISKGSNGVYKILYDNGNEFTCNQSNFVNNLDIFGNITDISQIKLNTGILKTSANTWDKYKDGQIIGGCWKLSDGGYVEYANNSPIKIIYPDGSYTRNATFEKALPYSTTLKASDYVINKGFMTFKSGKELGYTNGQPIPKNREDIEFIAKAKGLESLLVEIHYDKCNLRHVKGNDDDRVIVLNTKDNAKQINTTDYYINVASGYRFSWPKSFITKGYARGDGKPALEAESIKLNNVSYFDDDPGWPGDVRHYMIWVYKPVLEKDGITYGQTKGLYLLGFDDRIKYDLSETFTKGNNKAFKKVLPAPKKKTYHERGRVQECGICFGTGQGWGSAKFCPFCGGKGWYIEHEW